MGCGCQAACARRTNKCVGNSGEVTCSHERLTGKSSLSSENILRVVMYKATVTFNVYEVTLLITQAY